MEVILPRMTNVFRKDYLSRLTEMKDYHVRYPLGEDLSTRGGEQMFKVVLNTLEPIAARHPLYEPCTPLPELASATDHVMDHTFISGEGWLIPGEIREYPMCWRINWCFPPDRTKRYGGGRGDIPYSMQGLGEDCEVLMLFDSIPRGSLYHKRQRPRNAGIPAYRIAIRKGAGHLQTRTHCGADHGRCKAGFRQRHRYKQAMKKDTGHEFSCPASFGLSAMKDFGKCTTWRANESSRNVFSPLPHGKGKQPPNSRRKSRECGGWLFKIPAALSDSVGNITLIAAQHKIPAERRSRPAGGYAPEIPSVHPPAAHPC